MWKILQCQWKVSLFRNIEKMICNTIKKLSTKNLQYPESYSHFPVGKCVIPLHYRISIELVENFEMVVESGPGQKYRKNYLQHDKTTLDQKSLIFWELEQFSSWKCTFPLHYGISVALVENSVRLGKDVSSQKYRKNNLQHDKTTLDQKFPISWELEQNSGKKTQKFVIFHLVREISIAYIYLEIFRTLAKYLNDRNVQKCAKITLKVVSSENLENCEP